MWLSVKKQEKRAVVINYLNGLGMDLPSTTSWYELKQVCTNNELDANKILQDNYNKPMGYTKPAAQPAPEKPKAKPKAEPATQPVAEQKSESSDEYLV